MHGFSIDRQLKVAAQSMASGDARRVIATCKKILKRDPRNFDAIHLLGIGQAMVQNYQGAIEQYNKALRLFPSGTAALYSNLASAYLESDNHSRFMALEFAEKARTLSPNNADILEVSAKVHSRIGDYDQAELHLKQALTARPGDFKLVLKLVELLIRLNRYADAIRLLERLPSRAEVVMHRATIYDRQELPESAISVLNEARAFGVLNAEEADREMLSVLRTHGDRKQVADMAMRILNQDPDSVVATLGLILVGGFPGDAREAEQRIHELVGPTDLDAIHLFVLSEAYDREGKHEKSFDLLRAANRKKSTSQSSFLIERTKAEFGKIRESYRSFPRGAETEFSDSPIVPIFILGMPRSGTSLLEQMLASHTDVYGGGELAYLPSMIRFGNRGFRRDKKFRNLEYWRWVRENYLKLVSRVSDGSRFVTDKLPNNFQFIGFITKLFPEAKIIHCNRHPVSVCHSMYKVNFATDNHYAQDLTHLGQYYVEYRRLMDFWRAEEIEFFDHHYEELVGDPSRSLRRVLDYCGLDWQDGLLEFHKSERIVRTASNLQVRQPLYASSLESWKKYERQLQPLLETLIRHGLDVES